MRKMSAAAIGVVLATMASAAPAPWLEIKSQHFTVITNSSEKEGRRAAWQFEQIRQALRVIWPWAAIDGGKPIAIFAVRRGRNIADVFDFMAPLPGIGLCAGRIGNFINGELWGKPTEAAWGFIVDPAKLYHSQAYEVTQLCNRFDIRPCILHVHASQLYEAFLEGIVLFVVLWWFTSRPRPRLAPSGLFLVIYGIARFLVEFVRVPDEHIGYLAGGWLTMGQVLSLPMVIAGVVMLAVAYRRRVPSGNLAFAQ